MGKRIVGAGLIAALLAGCSSEKSTSPSISKMVLESVTQIAKSRKAGPPQKIELTAAQLAQVKQGVIQINPEALGGTDFLTQVNSGRDSRSRGVEVWKSSDNAQVFLRNGVVVGTRGVGGDIISADATMTINALRARSGRTGLRNYVISDGDVTTTEYAFRCTVQKIGTENITIVNQSITADHMREECAGGPRGDAELHNEYWVQRSNGHIRKSRQWIGPRIGYFEIIVLKL